MELTAFQIGYIVVESLIGLFAVIGNGFILYIFATEERLRKRRNYFLMSLAMADFLLAVVGIPTTIMTYLGLPANPTACMWELSSLLMTRLLCIYCITAISVDRLKAVINPIAYRNDTSASAALTLIVEIWIFSFLIGFLPLFGWNLNNSGNLCIFPFKIGPDYVLFFTIIGIIIPMIAIITIYTIIIIVIRRITQNSDNAIQSREVSATIRISTIVVTYVICELPISIVNILNSSVPSGLVTEVNLVHSFLVLAHLHSAINPFLYAFNVKDFRQACGKVLKYGEHELSSFST